MLLNILLFVIAGLFAVILLLVFLVILSAPVNIKARDKSIQTFLDTVDKHFPLKEVDCGSYSNMKLNSIMKFRVRQYHASGAGNLSVMTTNMGAMQMATVILTSIERDLPLISMDYIYILGKRRVYLEIYDLVLDPGDGYTALLRNLKTLHEQFNHPENVIPTPVWYDKLKTVGFYKKGSKADDAVLISLLERVLETVMVYGEALPELSRDAGMEKAKLQKTYSHGLIENGGVSTDVFVKNLGTGGTRTFFDRVLFKADPD